MADIERGGKTIDPERGADALQAYVADAGLRQAHGAAGEARSHDFAWDRINQTVAETYLRLIRQRGAGGAGRG